MSFIISRLYIDNVTDYNHSANEGINILHTIIQILHIDNMIWIYESLVGLNNEHLDSQDGFRHQQRAHF